jgi:hypothetical protein
VRPTTSCLQPLQQTFKSPSLCASERHRLTVRKRPIEHHRQIVERCRRTGVRTSDRTQPPDRPLIEAGLPTIEVELDQLGNPTAGDRGSLTGASLPAGSSGVQPLRRLTKRQGHCQTRHMPASLARHETLVIWWKANARGGGRKRWTSRQPGGRLRLKQIGADRNCED